MQGNGIGLSDFGTMSDSCSGIKRTKTEEEHGVCLYKELYPYLAPYKSADISFVKQVHDLGSEVEKKEDDNVEVSAILAVSETPVARDVSTAFFPA